LCSGDRRGDEQGEKSGALSHWACSPVEKCLRYLAQSNASLLVRDGCSSVARAFGLDEGPPTGVICHAVKQMS